MSKIKNKSKCEQSLPEGVTRTKEADIITFDDDESKPRFKMPCGHAIGAESLKEYCKSEMKDGKYEFLCPTCKQEWQSNLVRALAALSIKENQEFDDFLTQNFLFKGHGVQTCPNCGTYCERKNRKNPRVICPVCSEKKKMFEFCWYCLREWKTGGTSPCGNNDCPGEDPCLTILRSCPDTVIDHNKVTSPSVRACPSCYLLLEHAGGCKTMCCTGCNTGFCFICLSLKGPDGKLPCGIYSDVCEPAPLQKDIYQ